MNRQRGFTLPELMAVVVIIGVMASLAMVSVSRSRRADALDRFAEQVRDAIVSARRRAVATGTAYLVDIRPSSVAYCQRDLGNPAQNTCPTPANANCAVIGAPAPCESVAPMTVGQDARIVGYANLVDLGGGGMVGIGGGRSLVLFRNGTADSIPGTPIADGFTIYLQGTVDATKRRKVVVYPASGRPRIIETW